MKEPADTTVLDTEIEKNINDLEISKNDADRLSAAPALKRWGGK